MADLFGAAGDLLGGIGSIFGGNAQAKGDKIAAKFYGQAAELTGVETGIKELAVNRQIYQTVGGGIADAAASGLTQSGSAEDVMRSSAEQGALSKALVHLQGDITARGYLAQQQSSLAAASAAKGGGLLGGLGGLIGAAGALFSDDRLKKNIQLLGRREDGIGLYLFQYIYSDDWYEGALASDVERIRPDAISWKDGFRLVDYGMIDMELHRAGVA